MANREIPVSVRSGKGKGEDERKPLQEIDRIVTHGVPSEGCCYWAWVAFDEANNIVTCKAGVRRDGYGNTSNSAKFHGVIEALGWLAVNLPEKPVRVLIDAELIVKLGNGRNEPHKTHTKLLSQTARQFLSRTKATLEWKPRARSRRAALPSREASRRGFAGAGRMSHDRA